MKPCDYSNNGTTITQPGKFEGEPVWAPSFWNAGLEGYADEDDSDAYWFDVTDDDRREWPSLAGIARVELREDSNGFVRAWVHEY